MITVERNGLSTVELDALAGTLKGRVVGPRHLDWDLVRRGWNLAVNVHPAAVVEAVDVDDIAATVRFAGAHGLPVTAQPSGHGVTTELNGAIVLRTAALQELSIDTEARVARVGAGVKWQQLNEALDGTGLTGLPGSTGDNSVVGYHLGGGLAWFVRRHGLAAHRIRAIDLVDARGESARVTADSDPDVWWAMRGAGGDLGIATAIELDLLPLEGLYGGRLVWSAGYARDVLDAFSALTAEPLPEQLSLWTWLLNLPDVAEVPPPMRGQWVTTLDCTHLGTAADASALLEPTLRELPPPLVDTRGEMPLSALAGIAAEPVEPVPIHDDVFLLNRFGVDEVGAVLDTIDVTRPGPISVVEVRQLGGAVQRPGPDDGVAGVLEQPYAMVLGGPTPLPEVLAAAQAQGTALRSALGGANTGVSPPNFGPIAERNLTTEDLHRLRRVKQRVDPSGVIRSSRPIPPA